MRFSFILKLIFFVIIIFGIFWVHLVKSFDAEHALPLVVRIFQSAGLNNPEIRGKISFHTYLPPAIEISDIVVPVNDQSAELLHIDHLFGHISIIPFLTGKIRMERFSASGVHLVLSGYETKDMTIPELTAFPELSLKDLHVQIAGNDVVILENLTVESDKIGHITLTGRGKWRGQQFENVIKLKGGRELPGSGWTVPVSIRIVCQSAVIAAEGAIERHVGQLPFMRFAVQADDGNVADTVRLFGVNLPFSGKVRAVFNLSGNMARLRASDIYLVHGNQELLLFEARGAIADFLSLSGVDLAVRMSSSNILTLVGNIGFDQSNDVPVEFLSRVKDHHDGWDFSNISLKSEKSLLRGYSRLVTSGHRDHLYGTFVADRLSVPVNLGYLQKLSLAMLLPVDANINIHVKNLDVGQLQFDNMDVPLSLLNGRMDISAKTLGSGRADFSMLVDGTKKPAEMKIRTSLEQIDAGDLLKILSGVDTKLSGSVSDFQARLEGRGDSLGQIADHLYGEAVLHGSGGALILQEDNDFIHGLHKGTNRLACLYGRVKISDGMFLAEMLNFDFSSTEIFGRGSFNPRIDDLDLTMMVRPTEKNASNGRVLIDISGPLSHPVLAHAHGRIPNFFDISVDSKGCRT